MEETQKKTKGLSRKNKMILIIAAAALIIYFIGAFYFHSRFLPGTTLNGHKVGGQKAEEVQKLVENDMEAHKLTLIERRDQKEEITAEEIDLEVRLGDSVQKAQEEQNAFSWIIAPILRNKAELQPEVTYNEEKLMNAIDALACFKKENIVKPVNAKIKLKDGEFVVIDEIYGTTVKKDVLTKVITEAVNNSKTEIDLNKEGCYENPVYYADGKEVAQALKDIEKFTSVVMTYDFDYTTEVVDKTLIQDWIKVNRKMKAGLDYEKVLDYVEEIAAKYDTYATVREIKNSYGNKTKVYYGSYGWKISQTREAKELIKVIEKGKSVKREPIYLYEAVCRKKGNIDWDDTYAEVSIDGQQMWYYKNGKCVLSTSIVTGDVVRPGRATPKGTYALMYKDTDLALQGQGYSSHVNYWMPFTTNVGFHDASWRSSFGGSIYRGNGSHGCVNMPYYEAQALYSMIEPGCPVFVY